MADLIDLSPIDAYNFLQGNPNSSILIDIRSSMEYLFVGHPLNSVHVAWIDEPDWDVNPAFATEVLRMVEMRCKGLDAKTEAKVVLCCRSGKRTRDAAAVLLAEGFQHVLHVDEGFEGERDENHHRGTLGGWRFHGLPWEQC
ncbi:rhodanese-like domain-containing protein [Thiolinea disciformis]|uniref:rhodanese-like domain-containing protein n=1 Tax=Thiolinea disciformis TaxID=125614 RepID=UPI000380255D|nr:rhodanese-like domain-containing protein [Thiolinea disciformis]